MIPFKKFLEKIKSEGLGIKRSDMPQIPKEKYEEFVDYVENKGIIIEKLIRMPTKQLQPVQTTFKDKDIDELIEITDMSRAILISKDHFIVDGHHRWLVGLYTKQSTSLVSMINLNIAECLQLAKDFEDNE